MVRQPRDLTTASASPRLRVAACLESDRNVARVGEQRSFGHQRSTIARHRQRRQGALADDHRMNELDGNMASV